MPIYSIKNANGEVTNTIAASQEFVDSLYPGMWALMPEMEPVQVLRRHITVAAFFKRFGAHMLPILTSPEPVVQALVMLVRSHTYIDLDDPVLAQYLPQLIDFGLMEQSEIDALLELDTQPGEEP